jgi:hypothetical protein
MEERVTRLETLAEQTRAELVAIGTRLTRLEARSEMFATRDDVRAVEASVARMESAVHKELHAQTWKLIGVVSLLFAAAYGLSRLLH